MKRLKEVILLLQIITNLSELDFGQIMQVYHQSLQKSGADYYPYMDENQQLLEAEQDFYLFLKTFLHQNDSICAIWIEEGRYVSAVRAEPYQDGFLIEGLETAVNYRKRGNAENLLRAVSEYLLENYTQKIYSHIHKKNIPSVKTHLSCGFVCVLDYAVFVDGSVDNKSSTYIKVSHRS